MARPLLVPVETKALLDRLVKAFDEVKHPRYPEGHPKGGQFRPTGGGKAGGGGGKGGGKGGGETADFGPLPRGCRITQASGSDEIQVTSPYNADFVKQARKLGGRWIKDVKRWAFPAAKADAVREALVEYYGGEEKPPEKKRNKYAGRCWKCGEKVEANEGFLVGESGNWKVEHESCAGSGTEEPSVPPEARAATAAGEKPQRIKIKRSCGHFEEIEAPEPVPGMETRKCAMCWRADQAKYLNRLEQPPDVPTYPGSSRTVPGSGKRLKMTAYNNAKLFADWYAHDMRSKVEARGSEEQRKQVARAVKWLLSQPTEFWMTRTGLPIDWLEDAMRKIASGEITVEEVGGGESSSRAATEETADFGTLPPGCRITQASGSDAIRVASPYNADFVKEARKLGGRWLKEAKRWAFPASKVDEVREALERHYGGEKQNPQATSAGESAPAEDIITFSRGEGYGGRNLPPGTVIRDPRKGEDGILYIIRTNPRYFREDGMSFGVGRNSGHLYEYYARPATAEEAAPLLEREEKRRMATEAGKRRSTLADKIRSEGSIPPGKHIPEGERVSDTSNVYGGGDWFVIGDDYIWYVENNGMEGDDWSLNNVQTGGAGAIGWRVPYDEDLAEQIRSLPDSARKGVVVWPGRRTRHNTPKWRRVGAHLGA